MNAHVVKRTVRYKRDRAEHSARKMVSPFRVGDVRDGVPRERRSPNPNQAAVTVYYRTAASSSSPEHPLTSCRVCGAPIDHDQRHRAVAERDKAPTATFKPVTNKDSHRNNGRILFPRVSNTNDYAAP